MNGTMQSACGAKRSLGLVCKHPSRPARAVSAQAELNMDRRTALASSTAAVVAVANISAEAKAADIQITSTDWEVVDLPIEKGVVLLDIAFTGSDPTHGFLLGTRQTLLETFDAGKTWEPRVVEAAEDEGINYRYNSVSFCGDEGYLIGKPAILLHTTNGGKEWSRVPLSSKLPGAPLKIVALSSSGDAEMATESGAIYVTNNAAYSWKAAVQETVDATLNRTVSSGITGASYYEGTFANVQRNKAGDYIGISSRGNFYMTWSPGDAAWAAHNRPVTRRIQNLGWTDSNKVWVTTRGGDLLIADATGPDAEQFNSAKINSRGFGILDIGYRTETQAFACGGSGSLFKSEDGGRSFKRDRGLDQVPANLYAVEFVNEKQGYVLGNDGILLRYIGGSK